MRIGQIAFIYLENKVPSDPIQQEDEKTCLNFAKFWSE